MKLPKTVRIGPHTYDIIEVNSQEALSEGYHGIHISVRKVIKIDNTLKDSQVLESLLHEVCHAIWDNYKLSEDDDEERIVSVFGVGLLQVFKDNPAIRRAICG